MRKSNQTVKAFSIMDAVISMIITAIVVGVIFIIFSIMSGRLVDFQTQNNWIGDQNRLTYSFTKDIFESDTMLLNDSLLEFTGYSGKKTRYFFSERDIIRKKESFCDTFKVFNSKYKIDTLSSKSKSNVFQRFNLNIEINKTPITLNFYKKIEANELMNKLAKR